MNLGITAQLKQSFSHLLNLLNNHRPEKLNRVPATGSWSAAQVGEHLFKSYGVLPVLNGQTKLTRRSIDEKNDAIKKLFLNLDIKMKSPEEILPSQDLIDIDRLQEGLQKRTGGILDFAANEDLSLTCTEYEFPGFGHLTRLEWLYFIHYHTQRHTIQIEHLLK